MSVDARVDLDMDCDNCQSPLDEGDDIYCAKCFGTGAPKAAVGSLVDKVRWIGDELRDSKIDYRILDRVRELERELLA